MTHKNLFLYPNQDSVFLTCGRIQECLKIFNITSNYFSTFKNASITVRQKCEANTLRKETLEANTLINGENPHDYIDLTENTFKDTFYKHDNSFEYESKCSVSDLGKKNTKISVPHVNDIY